MPRAGGKDVPVEIVGPSGQQVKRLSVKFLQAADTAFTAGETGVYRVECQPGKHTVSMASSSHAPLIAGQSGPIHLLGTSGRFCFLVPSGVKQFAVRLCGEGDMERVSAALFDASGSLVWKQDDIATAQSCQIDRNDSTRDEVWRLQLSRPKVGVLEDHYVEMRGIPTILGLHPDGLLAPASH